MIADKQIVARVRRIVDLRRNRTVEFERFIEEIVVPAGLIQPERQIAHGYLQTVHQRRVTIRGWLRIEQVVVQIVVNLHVGDLRPLRVDEDLQLVDVVGDHVVHRHRIAGHVLGRHQEPAQAVLRQADDLVQVENRGDFPIADRDTRRCRRTARPPSARGTYRSPDR